MNRLEQTMEDMEVLKKIVNDMYDSIFDNCEMMNVISKTDCDTLISFLVESKENINEIIKKLEDLKNEK